MSNFTNTPNMSLAVPTIGVDPGPDYAINLNNDLSILDGHDHSPGYGVQITPSGLNINADLTFNDTNNLTNVRTVRFFPQTASPSGANDIGCIYELGNDLFYNDGAGNVIRLTQSGAIAGTPGSIAGLVAPASATFSPPQATFIWQSAAGIAANMDFGSAILRNLSPNSTYGLTLSPPAALSTNYVLTLPALPASNSTFLTINTNGAIQSAIVLDNSSLNFSGNAIQVANGGITGPKLANAAVSGINIGASTVTGSNIANSTITSANLNGLPSSVSSFGSGTGVGGSITTWASTSFTTTGRDVFIQVLGAAASTVVLSGGTGTVSILVDGNTVGNYDLTPGTLYPPSSFVSIATGLSAGSHTFSVGSNCTGGQSVSWASAGLYAFELR